MAAPIRMVEREVPNPRPAPSPEQRAGLLASLWLANDDETVVVSLEAFVRGVARQIAEAEETATRKRPPSVSAEAPLRLLPAPRASK